MLPAITAAITTFSDFSRTSGDKSAPTLPIAESAAIGSVNTSEMNSVGFDKSSTSIATSAVITTPFSSSIGVSGGKSLSSPPDSARLSTVTASPLATASATNAATIA